MVIAAGIIALGAAVYFTMTFHNTNFTHMGEEVTGGDDLTNLGPEAQGEQTTGGTGQQPATTGTKPTASTKPAVTAKNLGGVVSYTSQGFLPNRIVIQKGKAVHFVNQTDKTMWVEAIADEDHPIYPEHLLTDCNASHFDQCKEVGTGQSWDFTFNAVGTWKYDNHVRARDEGFVVVTE